mmetsp:Transcript_41179/g.101041  ORF Transcript_41179/g.101041 Transcript_41179/m.101041 type:complete len:217 (+) Transcript_41179:264-914(+)
MKACDSEATERGPARPSRAQRAALPGSGPPPLCVGSAPGGGGVPLGQHPLPQVRTLNLGQREALHARGRREVGVDAPACQPLEHAREDGAEQAGAAADVRVGVDLDQPRVHLLVEQEVPAEDLEGVALALRVQLPPHGVERRHHDPLDLVHDVTGVGAVGVELLEENRQLVHAQVVALLHRLVLVELILVEHLAPLLVLLLHRVVGQVDEEVVDVV